METSAIVLNGPGQLSFSNVELQAPRADDVVVEVTYSAISSGTEKRIWDGTMPDFPGMGYPLVPGYEAVGTVVETNADAQLAVGQTVFVPGSARYKQVKGLFGAAARHLVTPSDRVVAIDRDLGRNGTLLALAATAYHAVMTTLCERRGQSVAHPPDLVIGNGVLGRLIARICALYFGQQPVVWETNPIRQEDESYLAIDPIEDNYWSYRNVIDASGDPDVLNLAIRRIERGGSVTLAGFYGDKVSFAFPPAFLKEVRIAIAAEWQSADLTAVSDLIHQGQLSLGGLISHHMPVKYAQLAYQKAFSSPACTKMVIDWQGEA